MSELLIQLPAAQKKAIVGLACVVEAQGKGGRFKSNDPEVDIIIRECFSAQWAGNWDSDYKHMYLGEAVSYAINDMSECIEIASELDDKTKFHFKNLLLELAGGNALVLLVGWDILKKIGFQVHTNPEPKNNHDGRSAKENDGMYEVKNPYYARIVDTAAVRGENQEEFSLLLSAQDVQGKIKANYEQWLEQGVCPTNGLVGHSVKKVETEDGPLHFLYISLGRERCMVVPVLESGLESIDAYMEDEKKVNNAVLAYDHSGERCRNLREFNKNNVYVPKERPSKKESPLGTKVIHFMSSTFERFEPGNHKGPDILPRRIDLTYSNLGQDVKLEVFQVMKPRYAKADFDDGKVLTYKDINKPGYYYEVETSEVDGSVVRVSFFQFNAIGQRVEYRYTV